MSRVTEAKDGCGLSDADVYCTSLVVDMRITKARQRFDGGDALEDGGVCRDEVMDAMKVVAADDDVEDAQVGTGSYLLRACTGPPLHFGVQKSWENPENPENPRETHTLSSAFLDQAISHQQSHYTYIEEYHFLYIMNDTDTTSIQKPIRHPV